MTPFLHSFLFKAFVLLSTAQSIVLCVIPKPRGDGRMSRRTRAWETAENHVFPLLFPYHLSSRGNLLLPLQPRLKLAFPLIPSTFGVRKEISLGLCMPEGFIYPLSVGREVLGRDVRPGRDSSLLSCCLLVLPFPIQ